MLIDWFTVGAQMLNFVILVWLLKRYLYHPILNGIETRETRIAAELAAAASKMTEAQAQGATFQAKEKKFDAERAALLATAAEAAQADRVKLLGEARKEAEDWRSAQQHALRLEHARLGSEITHLVTGEVVDIARKTLGDLAASGLEERMGDVFTRHLQELNAKQREALAAALGSSSGAVVRSRFDLPASSKAAIQDALNRACSAQLRIRFETAAAGICGIEFIANGHKLAWNVADYLESLQRKMEALLGSEAVPPPPAPTATAAKSAGASPK